MLKILATGSYLPKNIVTNDELVTIMDTSDEWIKSRTGIAQRHISGKNESNADMCFEAAKLAIDSANIDSQDIDLVIVCTTTPDHYFPSVATKLQAMLELKDKPAFDLQAVCAGFVYGMHVADMMSKSGQYRNILLVCSEKMSSLLDWSERSTAVLFGDGAAAVLLQYNLQEDQPVRSGVLDSKICADGSLGHILYTQKHEPSEIDIKYLEENANFVDKIDSKGHSVHMQGQEVFKNAINKMCSSVEEILSRNNLSIDDINFVVPHQANARIIKKIAERLKIPEEKMVLTVMEHANCSAASIPLALDWLHKSNRLKHGDLLVFTAFGAGATWGTVLLRW